MGDFRRIQTPSGIAAAIRLNERFTVGREAMGRKLPDGSRVEWFTGRIYFETHTPATDGGATCHIEPLDELELAAVLEFIKTYAGVEEAIE